MTRFRTSLAVLALLCGGMQAQAYSTRIPLATTWKNSCAGIQSLVARNGAAVLTFGPRASASLDGLLFGYDYDRVAHDARQCLPNASLTPIWVPTRDNPQCFAGYTCSEGGGSNGGHHGR